MISRWGAGSSGELSPRSTRAANSSAEITLSSTLAPLAVPPEPSWRSKDRRAVPTVLVRNENTVPWRSTARLWYSATPGSVLPVKIQPVPGRATCTSSPRRAKACWRSAAATAAAAVGAGALAGGCAGAAGARCAAGAALPEICSAGGCAAAGARAAWAGRGGSGTGSVCCPRPGAAGAPPDTDCACGASGSGSTAAGRTTGGVGTAKPPASGSCASAAAGATAGAGSGGASTFFG